MAAHELRGKMNSEAPVIMHQDDLSLYQRVEAQCRDFGVEYPFQDKLPEPDAFVADNDIIDVSPNMRFKALHCPGHTPGSTSYYCEAANVVFPVSAQAHCVCSALVYRACSR